jgi:hypothetical protein
MAHVLISDIQLLHLEAEQTLLESCEAKKFTISSKETERQE